VNAFLSVLDSCETVDATACVRRGKLGVLQVNMGNLCNQSCSHCHMGASPRGTKVMSRKVVDDILGFLSRTPGLILDLTGGAPELNANFKRLISSAHHLVREIIVRSNLTVFFEEGKERLPDFFKENRVHLICSLPCYTKTNVERQRGRGVFEKSIEALQALNDLGYGREEGLRLDLVYNPGGPYLPPDPVELEGDYKRMLRDNFGVVFNRLITITNVPIMRFRSYLDKRGESAKYLKLLMDSFNPETVKNLMCRNLLSVGHDGRLYDCDFNQALGLELKDGRGNPVTIEGLDARSLEGREIVFGEHCFSCTAGQGSSCQGVLAH
jgi:radical SAM/Cys-rich protein